MLHICKPCPELSTFGISRLAGGALLILAFGVAVLAAGELRIHFTDEQLAVAESRYGQFARRRLVSWEQLLDNDKGMPEAEKLRTVNDFFNQIPWVSDEEHWGQNDYWATPTEVLLTNAADCEDFAIAKYFSLVALGVPMDKLRITYVKALNWNPIDQAHMVLTYYARPDAEPLVLDNLIPDIKPAGQRHDLVPIYSFNGDGLWLARQRGQGKLAGSSSRLSLWTNLNARMGRELQ